MINLQDILKIVLSTVIPSVCTGLIVYVKQVKKRNSALENGVLSLLRTEIIRQHDKWTNRGYCPIYAKDALEKAYIAYHDLGGNGTITKLYQETINLKSEE